MQLPDSVRMNHRAAITIQIAALCLFVLAFFLPACRDRTSQMHGADTYPGWLCAEMTLIFAAKIEDYFSRGILAIMSGWINPLTLIFVVLSVLQRLPRTRRVLAGVILLCLIATWIFLAVADLVPLIGHFLWAISAVAIVAADTLSSESRGAPSGIS